jgi:hypothetical protein
MRAEAFLRQTVGVAALLCVCAGTSVANAADPLPPPTVEAGDLSDDVDRPVDERARMAVPAAVNDGPTVELITGGQSKDGTARVGRLPVLD